MKIGLIKLLVLYFLVFGLLAALVQLDASLHDYRINGDFFLRTSPLNFFISFFTAPLFALMAFFFSFPTLSTFAPDVVEIHAMIIMFFGLAAFGLWKDSRFIVLVAALVPLCWAIFDLDLLRYA